tara:strand:+ start:310 stop:513 length:204 start_codon:yes stop_codon:yes gene_type:complete
MNKDQEIMLLRKNVKDLQSQLQNAYKRIDKLNEELHKSKGFTGWASMESWSGENPDATHIEKNKNDT